MKKLPVGIQSIREILTEGHIYADKTMFAKLLIEGGKHYFMSRPRRFGKSLFLNTLQEIFKGNKELFKECQIYGSEYLWQRYPVIHFDFSRIASRNPRELEESLKRKLHSLATEYELSINVPNLQEGLNALVMGLAKKYDRVAILVDEHDNPIINNLKNLEIARSNRDLLKIFFTALKGLDDYTQFTFVTGVSTFSYASLSSGSSHLTDITLDPQFATTMGYTEEELRKTFESHIQAIAHERSRQGNASTEESILKEIWIWYKGYRFSEREVSVYNPYSVLRFLSTGKAESYWYSTGTPSFLMDEIKNHPQSVITLSGMPALKSTLSDMNNFERIHLAALMFQTGYLTIHSYNSEENSYQLDFPNREVKDAFFTSLLEEFTHVDPLESTRAGIKIKKDLEAFNLPSFFKTINVHFAKMPHHLFTQAKEGFYHAVFYTFLAKSGITPAAEIPTNIGRIDLSVELPKAICIFELKLDKTAEIAFDQTEARKYREKYSLNEKDILVIGVNFSSKSRNIDDWKGSLYSPLGELKQEILPPEESP